MPRKQVISIHVGQAGVQIGNAVWELYCLEHGIRPDGYLYHDCEWYDDYDAVFSLDSSAKITPRALMVDLESIPIDEVRNGAYSCLFAPQLLLTGCEDAASNFGRGYFTTGSEMIDNAVDIIRLIAEDCPLLQGVNIFRSFGGGTGSGFTSLLMENLAEDFPKKCKILFSVYPSPQMSSITTEPYNTILSTHKCFEHEDFSLLMDNEAIYGLLDVLEVQHPTFTNVNRLIAQVVSSATSSLRFEGPLRSDLIEFQTNLLPYPRIHFPTMAYSPLIPGHKCKCATQDMPSAIDLTSECFEPCNQFLSYNQYEDKMLACCMFFRGDVSLTDINYGIYMVKNSKVADFVDWCPTGFKIAINYQPPTTVPIGDLAPTPRSLCMLYNGTGIRATWADVLRKFEIMYAKRAFIHHYLNEGMETADFDEAKETAYDLIEDYSEVES